jgi:hypothetical protein
MLQKRTPPFVRNDAVVGRSAGAPETARPVAVAGFAIASALPESEADIEVEMEVEAEPAAPVTTPAAAWPAPSIAAPPAPPPPPAPSAWPTAAPAHVPSAPVVRAPPEPSAWPAPAPAQRAPEPEVESEPEVEAESSSWAMPTPVAKAEAAPAPPAPAPPAAASAVASAPAPEVAAPAEKSGTLDPRELLKGGAKPIVDAGQATSSPKVTSRWKPVREQMKTGEVVDPAMAAIPEADRAKHVEARKIARLLVSEIKLYNEAKVAVGRKNRDLYERLKEDIERSRQTYVQRIDADVAAKSDYFQDELVATLAEGDGDALGAGR